MAQVYVNGPAEIHTRTGGLTESKLPAYEFLGWSIQGVRIDLRGAFDDVPSDYSGSQIPFDVQSMGMEAYVSADINVYNEGLYRKIANRVRISDLGPSSLVTQQMEGVAPRYSVGFLMRAEQIEPGSGAFGLMVFAPYGLGLAAKPQFTTMDRCYQFFNAYLDDAATLELGSRYKKIRTVFRCLPVFDPHTNPYGSFLFDHDSSGRVSIGAAGYVNP